MIKVTKVERSKLKVLIPSIVLLFSSLTLCSCAAMQTQLEHKDLQQSAQQSETIFLDPVPKSLKTVHVIIKNTSDQDVSITQAVKSSIETHGFKVVSNPNRAHYLLQANILSVGKMSIAASKEALGHGYGSVISGVGTAAAVGALGGSGNAMLGAGLVGGLVDMAASSLVKDVNYTMITDVQVSERVGHKVSESTKANLQNGSSSQIIQKSNKTSNFQRYRTRIVSNADKVNLKFEEAKPELEKSLVKVLAGIF